MPFCTGWIEKRTFKVPKRGGQGSEALDLLKSQVRVHPH